MHRRDLALALGQLLDDDALILVGHVDGQLLHGLEHVALVVGVGDDLRARHAQLHALAAHLLDEDAQVQFAPAGDLHAVGASQVFHAEGYVHP